MTPSSKAELSFSDDELAFITMMHEAAQRLSSDDSALSNTPPLNYHAYYTIYEQYANRVLEIEQRINELQTQEYSLINDKRRLDKTRDEIKQKVNCVGLKGLNVHQEGYKRQKLEQKQEEKRVCNHFTQSHNTDIEQKDTSTRLGYIPFRSIAKQRSLPLINGSTAIFPATLECLEPGEWLSDEIIDFGS